MKKIDYVTKRFVVMIRILFVSLIVFVSAVALAQEPFDKYTADTIQLPEFHPKKIVAYKLQQVTIYVSYEDFFHEFLPLYKRYKNGMNDIKEEKEEGDTTSSDYELRFNILDTTYKLLKASVTKKDTVFLKHETFARYQFRELINFDKHIENGTCAIIDNSNKRHYRIIRQKGSWYRGPLNAWGG